MSTTQKILLSAALGMATLGLAAPAEASAPAPVSGAHAELTSDQSDATTKKACRWVWGKGLICNTPTGTINI